MERYALVTTTQEDCILLAKEIWANIVLDYANQDISQISYWGSSITIEELNALSVEQKSNCWIAKNIPNLVNEGRYTIRYANVRKIYEKEEWFIFKPEEKYLVNITVSYTEKIFNSSWFPEV